MIFRQRTPFLLFGILVLVLAGLLAGCGGGSNNSGNTTTNATNTGENNDDEDCFFTGGPILKENIDFAIVPGQKLSGIEIGNNYSQVISLYGKSCSESGGRFSGDLYEYGIQYHPDERFLLSVILRGTGTLIDDNANKVIRIGIGEGYPGVTDLGVGIGTPIQDVLDVYGEPDISGQGNYSYNETLGIYFYAPKGIVTTINVMIPDNP